MILTNIQLVRECKRMAGATSVVPSSVLVKDEGGIRYYAKRYGYVLGAQGHLYSKELAEKWGAAKRANKSKSYFVNSCAHWFGRLVTDCSGMIVEAFRAYKPEFGDKTADYFYNSYTVERGPVSTMPEEKGLIVWKKGHIGIYIGNEKVIEARGYKYGVVVSKLSTQKWTNWGRLKDVAYQPVAEPKPEFRRVLQYKRGKATMRGDDVLALQKLLAKKAQFTGTADGSYGPITKQAVVSFQLENGLNGLGRAGKKTIEKLGGKWVSSDG